MSLTKDEAMEKACEALERAEHLLDATSRFFAVNPIAAEYTVVYDEARCDGGCLGEDCRVNRDNVLRALAALKTATDWQPISEAPKDGGKTWIIGRGKFKHPFDPAVDQVVHAQIYWNRLVREWLDPQCESFLPTEFIPLLPAPPSQAEVSDAG